MKSLLLAPFLLMISGCDYFSFLNQSEDHTIILRYRDFIEAVQKKEINRVLINPDSPRAEVIDEDGLRYEVYLAPDKDLVEILTENNVDIAVTPTRIIRVNPLIEFLNYFFK